MRNKNTNNSKRLIITISIAVLILIILSFMILIPKSIETIKDSVVMIKVYDKYNNQISTGSGFCAYKSNYIVTNFHVIEGAYKIKITTDENKEYPVEDILIFNEAHDLAILSGGFNLKPIPIGKSAHLKAGNTVTAIGSPKGELNTVSTGVISNADNDYEIRITAPISPGSSGGVLLNKFNRVIGITYATYNAEDSQNLNYAISVSYLNKMYDHLINNDYVALNTNSNYIIDDKYYSANSFVDWYALTSPEGKLETALSDDWYNIYNSFSNETKQNVCKCSAELETIDPSSTNIAKNINNWSVPELFIKLKILDVYQYSIAATDISLCNNKDEMFRIIEEYPLEAAEKSLILYLIGDYDWSEIHKDNKEDIFDYFDAEYGTADLGAILELLGYTVEYESDGTLTAWW